MIWSITPVGERNVPLKPDPAMRPEPSCLFPSDEEIARLLFGSDKGRAKLFEQSLAAEERRGLPRKHPAYGARYWPAVKAYYDYEWGLITEPPFSSAADETIPTGGRSLRPDRIGRATYGTQARLMKSPGRRMGRAQGALPTNVCCSSATRARPAGGKGPRFTAASACSNS